MENNDKALIELFKELYFSEKRTRIKTSIFCYVLMAIIIISITLNVLLVSELNSYNTVTITETTTETYTNDVEGDGANIVNGNQYNDNATHNET